MVYSNNSPSNFFTEHTGRLSSLLDAVIIEANASTNPYLANDYADLIDILRDLLAQAQTFSHQGPEQLRGRWQEVQLFTSRVQAVQDAIANWKGRCQVDRSPCKKRGRSETLLDVEGGSACVPPDLKRSRSQDEDVRMGGLSGFTTVVPLRPAAPNTLGSPSRWAMEE